MKEPNVDYWGNTKVGSYNQGVKNAGKYYMGSYLPEWIRPELAKLDAMLQEDVEMAY